MIQLTDAGKRFGHKLLFQELDWMITPKDHVGLVGGNGTGKSTLLKIIGGFEHLDYGSLTIAKGVSARISSAGWTDAVGTDGVRRVHGSVLECSRDRSGTRDADTPDERNRSGTGEEYVRVADRFHRLDSEFRARDGYTIEAKIGTVLNGLGFRKEDWTRRTEEFSGGWQMRIALAKLLLEQPNILLLDEPTNHLDLEARNWLEEYLTTYPFAFVLISHDRYFLDVTVDKIAELWNKRVYFYSGNYEKFLAQKGRAEGAARSGLQESAGAHRATGSHSSTGSGRRRQRPSRSRAVSRNWRKSSVSRSRRMSRRSTSLSRSRSRAAVL